MRAKGTPNMSNEDVQLTLNSMKLARAQPSVPAANVKNGKMKKMLRIHAAAVAARGKKKEKAIARPMTIRNGMTCSFVL